MRERCPPERDAARSSSVWRRGSVLRTRVGAATVDAADLEQTTGRSARNRRGRTLLEIATGSACVLPRLVSLGRRNGVVVAKRPTASIGTQRATARALVVRRAREWIWGPFGHVPAILHVSRCGRLRGLHLRLGARRNLVVRRVRLLVAAARENERGDHHDAPHRCKHVDVITYRRGLDEVLRGLARVGSRMW